MEYKLIVEIMVACLATATFMGTLLFSWLNLQEWSIDAETLFTSVEFLLSHKETFRQKVDLLLDETKIERAFPKTWFDLVDEVTKETDDIRREMGMTQSSWNWLCGLFRKLRVAEKVKICLVKVRELRAEETRFESEELVTNAPEMLVILKSNDEKFNSLKKEELELTRLRTSMANSADQNLAHRLASDWFEKIDSLIKKVKDTYEEYQTVLEVCTEDPDPCLECNVCKNLYEVGKNMQETLQETESFLKDEPKVADVKPMPIPKYVLGHERELQRAMQLIQENCSVVIWGMGGIGKTTLLSRINNHFYGKHVTIAGFDVVIFVTAGRGACIPKVQVDIGKRLGIELSETGIIHEQASEIWKSLKCKNFLLLVDDIWEDIEPTHLFKSVEIGDPTKRNVVVMTARNERILLCRQIERVEVNLLSEDLSWELFRNHFDGESLLQGNEGMKDDAEDIAKKCGGLPKALVAAGKLMSKHRQENAWRVARRKLVDPTQICQVSQDMKEVFISLKFSLECFHHGRDDKLKILFLCLYHEDGISITDLLQRLLMESMQDVRDEIYFKDQHVVHIIELFYNGLLMCSERVDTLGDLRGSVRLHKCVGYMLAWLIDSGEDNYLEMVRYNYNGLKAQKELPHLERWENAVRINMRRFPEEKISEGVEIPDCKKLSSFLAKESCFICLPRGFFDYMKLLRLLDLSYLRKLEELPGSIRSLINLRWLDLSWCDNLKKLPKEMQHLKQLVYLFLQETPKLKDIPRECFSELHKLQELDLRNCAFEWTWDSDKQQASLHDIRKLMKDGVLRGNSEVLSISTIAEMHQKIDGGLCQFRGGKGVFQPINKKHMEDGKSR